MNEQQTAELTQTSPELLEALAKTIGNEFGRDSVQAEALHTGGGIMVAAVDLSIDGRFHGRQVWLTREDANEWLLGLYDFYMDEEDEGLCVAIRGTRQRDGSTTADSPQWVAAQVAGILARLGVDKLQGE